MSRSNQYRKIVVASDSFKGSLSSLEVAQSVAFSLQEVVPDCEEVCVGIADGGEGITEALCAGLGGKRAGVQVHDPLMRPITAYYALLADRSTAVIEMSVASGLVLLTPEERCPLITTTYGTGELIRDALGRGCRRFIVGIGGSATNDGGTGMLSALGYRFFDREGKELDCCGGVLQRIDRIDDTRAHPLLKDAKFRVACDVDTLFCGSQGATRVFAPQKGATPADVELLERGMQHFAQLVKDHTQVDITTLKGAGAAGGLGGALHAFLGAQLTSGIDLVLDELQFNSIIADADLVITGEGKLDRQTAMGKAPAGVLRRAKTKGIPVIALGGSVKMCPELKAMGFAQIRAVTPVGMALSEAINPSTATANIKAAVVSLFQ